MTALRGMTVLDLTAGGAGSLAAALLADFDADVVRPVAVDPRTRPDAALPDWLVWNRGKRLALHDPSAPADRSRLAALAESCDVLFADCTADLAAHGIAEPGEPDTRVLVFTPPYDRAGTPWLGGAESPELLEAYSGLSRYQASYSGDPVDSVYPYLRYAHALWAATCAVAALTEREASGLGQTLTVGGLHAVNVFGGYLHSRPADEPDPDRAIGPGGLNPMYTRYRAGDGRWIFVGGLGPKFSARILTVTGSSHLLEDPRVQGRLDRLWHRDNSAWVIDHFARLYGTRPAGHWIDLLGSHDVPCTPLYDRDEWFAGEQVAAIDQRVEVRDPLLGPVTMPGAPVTAEAGPAALRPPAAAQPIAALDWLVPPTRVVGRARGERMSDGPLAGYRVAGLGSYVAGPYVGCLLAELGAEVLKFEPPQGDPWRLQGFAYNRGVKSVALDLRHPDGRAAARSVLAGCDVVIDNFRLGVMARLGIDHARLHELSPRIVTVAITAYGERGPLADRPGYDPVLQAASGMMTAQGGGDDPVVYSMPPNDHTAGCIGAFAAVVGLLHRERTGVAQHLSTSLAAASVLLQASDLVHYPDRSPGRSGGRDFPGPYPHDRSYPVADGFIRLQGPVDVARWRGAGLDLEPGPLAADPATEIGRVLAGLSAADAVARLRAAGVPAVPVRKLSQVSIDRELHAAGLLAWFTAPNGVRFSTVGRMADFARTTRTGCLVAPGLGEHTREVLERGGIADDVAERLVTDGVAVDGGSLDLVFLPAYR